MSDKPHYQLLQSDVQVPSEIVEAAPSASDSIANFPTSCRRCGVSDASLRITIFPYVTSIILLTFRKSWTGIYCNQCRKKEMLEAKIISTLFGWWGFPFGVLYTLGAIFKPSQGHILEDVNAIYLQGLGAYFLSCGKIIDAEQAFAASLWHRYDKELDILYQQVFDRKPQPPAHVSYGQGSGFLFGIGVIILMGIILVFVSADNTSGETKVASLPKASPVFTQAFVSEASPTSKQVPTPKPIHALKIVQPNPPKGWQKFVSKQTNFSAYVPEELVPEEDPPKEGNPARAVSFASDSNHVRPDSIVISVVYFPYLDMAGHEPTELELKEYINKWLTRDGIKIITPPAKIDMDGYLAFEVVHQVVMTDRNYIVRAYDAFISTPNGLYYVEVSGFLDYDNSLKEYYDTFMDWFQPGVN